MNILTTENLERIVPAAFAEEPASTVSDRYSFISSRQIIDQLASQGWFPVRAHQSRRARNQRHTTHMIVFQREKFGDLQVGGVLPQIYLFNNHAAQRRAQLRGGLFRGVCSNGLVIALSATEIAYIHIDGAAFDFDKAFQTVLGDLEGSALTIESWMDIKLNFVQQLDFAAKAVLIRNQNDPYWSRHFDAREFLTRRRPEDKTDDLWTVYNVVQENILKGGVQGANRTTKPITQVTEIQRINESLWQLVTEFGQLHSVN